jgi:hypothetical protein
VAEAIGKESPGRVVALAEAKVIEADPEAHAEKVAWAAHPRFVTLSRADEAGLKTVIARVTAGGGAWIEATLDRAADLLASDHPELSRDELRSTAFGLLARPAELLALLLTGVTEQAEDEPAEPCRALALPTDALDALRTIDPAKLRPPATLYVHLHEAVLAGLVPGVARVEGGGPLLPAQLRDLLGAAHVSLQPVIDLNDDVQTSAYEHPESLKERVWLSSRGDVFPFSTGSDSRRVDYDHPIPYDPLGPSGQTGTHNSGPLRRRHHRWKTHAGYRARQCGAGRYVWLTPHGLGFLVDHRGTRRISADEARLILDAPPDVDIYPT